MKKIIGPIVLVFFMASMALALLPVEYTTPFFNALVARGWIRDPTMSSRPVIIRDAPSSPKLPTISVERIFVDDFRTTRATIRVRNDVETRGFSSVAIQCVWLSNGVAIDESSAETSSVGYGETTFKTMIGPGNEFKADEARCKVLRVR